MNAPTLAAERGGSSETSRPRERGIADVVEVTVAPAGDGKAEISALDRALWHYAAVAAGLDGIAVESALAGTC